MIFLRYYIPARRINVAKLGLFIRKDWLDKLNMAEPTTTEEWVAYLRAAKEAKLGGEQTVPYAMKLYENSPLFSTSVIVDSFLDFSKIHGGLVLPVSRADARREGGLSSAEYPVQ